MSLRSPLVSTLLVASSSFAVACSETTAPMPAPPEDDALYADQTDALLPDAAGLFTMDVGLADLDGDGDVDAILAVEFGQNRLYLNDGSGRFLDTGGRLPVASHDSEDIALADFDGDGDIDAVVVSEDDRTNEYYVNDGQARFTLGPFPVTGTSNGVVTGDLDGDGDVDLVVGNAGPEFVLLNDGSGNWTDDSANRIPAEATGVTQDVELGDLDGDGDLDLLVANEDGNRVLLNDGTGAFTDETVAWLPVRGTQEETREADLGDIDGDGDLDAFFANTASSFASADPADRLLLNVGGRFEDVSDRLPPASRRSFDGEFWDVDGDGDLDIVTGGIGTGFSAIAYTVLINDGEGRFSVPEEPVFPGTAAAFGFDTEMADLTGDGRPDFYLASRGSQDRLLVRRP